jgi:hypothetical protein
VIGAQSVVQALTGQWGQHPVITVASTTPRRSRSDRYGEHREKIGLIGWQAAGELQRSEGADERNGHLPSAL